MNNSQELIIEEAEVVEATEKRYSNGCWGCDGGFC